MIDVLIYSGECLLSKKQFSSCFIVIFISSVWFGTFFRNQQGPIHKENSRFLKSGCFVSVMGKLGKSIFGWKVWCESIHRDEQQRLFQNVQNYMHQWKNNHAGKATSVVTVRNDSSTTFFDWTVTFWGQPNFLQHSFCFFLDKIAKFFTWNVLPQGKWKNLGWWSSIHSATSSRHFPAFAGRFAYLLQQLHLVTAAVDLHFNPPADALLLFRANCLLSVWRSLPNRHSFSPSRDEVFQKNRPTSQGCSEVNSGNETFSFCYQHDTNGAQSAIVFTRDFCQESSEWSVQELFCGALGWCVHSCSLCSRSCSEVKSAKKFQPCSNCEYIMLTLVPRLANATTHKISVCMKVDLFVWTSFYDRKFLNTVQSEQDCNCQETSLLHRTTMFSCGHTIPTSRAKGIISSLGIWFRSQSETHSVNNVFRCPVVPVSGLQEAEKDNKRVALSKWSIKLNSCSLGPCFEYSQWSLC